MIFSSGKLFHSAAQYEVSEAPRVNNRSGRAIVHQGSADMITLTSLNDVLTVAP